MSLLFRQHVGLAACCYLALQKTVVQKQANERAATNSQSLAIRVSCRRRHSTAVGEDAPL